MKLRLTRHLDEIQTLLDALPIRVVTTSSRQTITIGNRLEEAKEALTAAQAAIDQTPKFGGPRRLGQ